MQQHLRTRQFYIASMGVLIPFSIIVLLAFLDLLPETLGYSIAIICLGIIFISSVLSFLLYFSTRRRKGLLVRTIILCIIGAIFYILYRTWTDSLWEILLW